MITLRLRKAATSLALIIAVTAAARIAFAAYKMRRISSPRLEQLSFDNEVGSVARSLATGRGFRSPYNRETGPTAILPPVYPLIVAGVCKIFGIQSAASFRVLLSLNILFAALTCIPIYKLGQMLDGPSLAAAAAWLWALFPNGIVIPFEWIWETSLSALLVALLIWLTIKLAQAPSLQRWIVYGLLWGLALMTNPALGAALPVLLLWAAWHAHKFDPGAWRNAAFAVVLALVCCLPWTIRNYAVFHRFIPLRSGFGFELYIGNNENYAEPRVWPPRVSYEREVVRYTHLGEVPFMDEEKRKAFIFIHANPTIALRLCAERFVEFWTGTMAPVQALRSDASLLDRFIVLCNLVLPLLLLGGCVRLAVVRSPFLLPLAAMPVFYPLVYYITHTSLRYRHAIDPCLFLLACAAFVSSNRLRTGRIAEPRKAHAA
jgi:4-amino-4-deoxy-L-arabinose transferase-like glycosyltransferase